MPDRAAIFADILVRQRLCREARLPLLDVRAEYDRAARWVLWKEHVEQHHAEVRARVLHAEREKHGPTYPVSAGGRWAIAARVRVELERSFRMVRNDPSSG